MPFEGYTRILLYLVSLLYAISDSIYTFCSNGVKASKPVFKCQ